MSVAQAKTIGTLKKLRNKSVDELWTRGIQTVSAYRDGLVSSTDIPTDEEFRRDIDASQFGKSPIISESLWQKFFKNGDAHFFPSFVGATAQNFKQTFGEEVCNAHIERAERIIAGRIDLLGYEGLEIGEAVEWHREPLSGIRSPNKHWKLFDELDCSDTGDRKIIWELNRHQHFFTLGIAYVLTEDERFAETFASHLNSWIDQNPYGIGINWSSSLEVSFRAISWIWAFHLLRHSNGFSLDLFKKALKVLHLHGRHIEKYLSTYFSPNTHLTGEALGLYYLGTQLPFFSRAKRWRELGESILIEEAKKQFHPDGVYFEQSTWYHRYSVDFYLQFLLLRKHAGRLGEETIPGTESRISRALDFLMHVQRPDGTTPLIGDDDGGRCLPLTTNSRPNDFRGTLACGANLFERGDLKFAAGEEIREELFWWFGPDGVEAYSRMTATEPLVTTRQFPDGGYVAMRDGWTATDNFMLVDCGEIGALSGGHGHADTLAIEVAVGGRALLVDPGTCAYHAHDLRNKFRSTSAHNSLTVDDKSSSEPGGVFGWNTRADATANDFISTERFDYFCGSHRGYSRLIDNAVHTRSIIFLRNDYWIIHDLITATGKHSYSLDFNFAPGRVISAGDEGAFLDGGDNRIFTFGDGGGWLQSAGSVSEHYGRKAEAPRMSFVFHGRGPQEFFTFLLPSDSSVSKPDVSEVDLEAGRAFIISTPGYNDVFVAGDPTGTRLSTELFDTDFQFSWARLAEDSTTPDEYLMINGRDLFIGQEKIVSGVSRNRYVAIRRVGSDLYLDRDGERSVRPLPL